MRLAGKIGIVTGAASGLGRQTARALAERGVRLLLFDRDATGLSETAAACPGAVMVCGDASRGLGDRHDLLWTQKGGSRREAQLAPWGWRGEALAPE